MIHFLISVKKYCPNLIHCRKMDSKFDALQNLSNQKLPRFKLLLIYIKHAVDEKKSLTISRFVVKLFRILIITICFQKLAEVFLPKSFVLSAELKYSVCFKTQVLPEAATHDNCSTNLKQLPIWQETFLRRDSRRNTAVIEVLLINNTRQNKSLSKRWISCKIGNSIQSYTRFRGATKKLTTPQRYW